MSGNDTFSIIVGVDGSAGSRLALDWAVGEARMRHGRVRAVTAWDYPPVTVGMEGLRWDPDIFEQVARTTQADALKRVDAEGVSLTGEVTQGPAAAVLLKASKDADLVVVGSRGLGGFTGLLLGSVSTQTLNHAGCPVLVVRPGPHPRTGR
jgi:nucleotide-binding universal stress UspA family protein